MSARLQMSQISKLGPNLVAMLLLIGCSSQRFSGDTGKRSGADAQPKPITAVACTEARLLSVQSLGTFVDQSKSERSVDVELTFEPCANQKGALLLPIMFDLDATLSFIDAQSSPIGYILTVEGAPSSTSGQMNYIKGSDLFGKSGPAWGHFESSGPLSASPTFTKAILKLKLANVIFYGLPNSPVMSTNFTVPMNVRIGQSQPVVGNITLTPVPAPQIK